MKILKNYLIFLLPIFAGCSSMYIPSPKPTPLFEKKGETQIEVGTSINSPFLIASYSFSEKYALIGSGSLSYRNFMNVYERPGMEFDLFSFPDGAFAHRAVELGIGRYNIRPSSNYKLEVFIGGMYGNAKENKDWKNNYYQCFIQTNIGRKKEHFELGGAFRLAFSLFDNYKPYKYSPSSSPQVLHNTFGVAHTEALLFMKFGGENLKGVFRFGLNVAIPFISTSNREIIWHRPIENRNYSLFHISIGLTYRFNMKSK